MIKVSKWLNKRKNWRNWNYWITYKNGYARLLVLRLFPLQSMAYFRNIASLNLFYRYYFGRCAPEVAELVPLPYSRGRSTRYSDRLDDFSMTICICYKDVYVNSFFTCTARIWNFLARGCFPLTNDLSGFKSRINKHILTLCFF